MSDSKTIEEGKGTTESSKDKKVPPLPAPTPLLQESGDRENPEYSMGKKLTLPGLEDNKFELVGDGEKGGTEKGVMPGKSRDPNKPK